MTQATEVCPACGHDKGHMPQRYANWLRRLLGRPPLAAVCGVDVDVSGWGGEVCECRDPHHGS